MIHTLSFRFFSHSSSIDSLFLLRADAYFQLLASNFAVHALQKASDDLFARCFALLRPQTPFSSLMYDDDERIGNNTYVQAPPRARARARPRPQCRRLTRRRNRPQQQQQRVRARAHSLAIEDEGGRRADGDLKRCSSSLELARASNLCAIQVRDR